jgi:hypothetical protein
MKLNSTKSWFVGNLPQLIILDDTLPPLQHDLFRPDPYDLVEPSANEG